MFKNIKNLILYDMNYIFNKKKYIYIYMLASIIMIQNVNSKISGINLNLWDLYGYVFMNSMMVIYIPCIISIYFSALIFFDSEINAFMKIRISNKRDWFISKIVVIFIFNIVIILILTLLTLLIGAISFGISTTWSSASIIEANKSPMYVSAFKYVNFYSPIKLIFINSITFATFMTFIGVLSSLSSLKFNRPKIGLLLPVIYIVSSLLFRRLDGIKILKYITYQNYVLFGQRNYYNFGDPLESSLTVFQAFVIPILLLLLITVLGYILIKKVDFSVGEKRLWE